MNYMNILEREYEQEPAVRERCMNQCGHSNCNCADQECCCERNNFSIYINNLKYSSAHVCELNIMKDILIDKGIAVCKECGEILKKERYCEECHNCNTCCTCWTCDRCNKVFGKDDAQCDCCGECEDCCTCWTCEECGRRKNKNDYQCSECNRCGRCCTCWTCNSCDERFREDDFHCSECDCCESCCDCHYCNRCNERIRNNNFCHECERCEECCECSSNDGLYYTNDGQQDIHIGKSIKLFKENTSHRTIGVEIETSICDTDGDIRDKIIEWGGEIVPDGSVDGIEVVTAPANGDLFLKQIKEVCEALRNDNADVDRKCGLHVHIGAKDFHWYDLRKLIILYASVEDMLFQMVPKSRRDNNYCRPCGDDLMANLIKKNSNKESKAVIANNIYGQTDTKGFKTYQKPRQRYRALNLHSWVYRGTVEFRLHSGTIDYDKITKWSMLLAAIVDYAYNHTEKEVIETARKYKNNIKYIINDIKNKETAKSIQEFINKRIAKFAGNYTEDN